MMSGRLRSSLIICLALAFATFLVFARVAGHEFISYDDNLYVTDNQMVRGGLSWGGFAWAFTTFHSANWHPLTWLSHMLDVQLFGMRPGAHHIVNVIFHVINTVLLFLILAKMTGALWRSAIVAALFALHPLHVESVAWISERKDVLSAFFGLLTILAYVRYAERPRAARYLPVLVFLILGLLSKPMLVTIPLLLLLLDYWPLGRMRSVDRAAAGTGMRKLLAEKVPLLLAAAASGIVTVIAQKKGEAVADLSLGIGLRIANASVGYVRYLGKTFLPEGLSVFYPHPGAGIPAWQVAGASFLLLAVTGLVLMRLRRSPWLAVGWFWFVVALAPVSGIIQAGAQSIADRYTYLPLVGVFVMVVWEVPELLRNRRIPHPAFGTASVVMLLVLSTLTWRQLGFWRDHETLFRHAVSVTKNNCVALSSLADYLARKGAVDEAYADFREALRLCPGDEGTWYNLGLLQRNRGEMTGAEASLREALRLKPPYTKAWVSLGSVYMASGRLPEAIDALLEATRTSPDDPSVWFTLGVLYGKNGQSGEAVDAYRRTVLLRPDYGAAWNNLGITYKNLGRISEAATAFGRAAEFLPDDPMVWYNLGVLHAGAGNFPEAIRAFRNAIRIRADHEASWYQLGMAYASMGRTDEAQEAVRALQTIDPGLAGKLSSHMGRR